MSDFTFNRSRKCAACLSSPYLRSLYEKCMRCVLTNETLWMAGVLGGIGSSSSFFLSLHLNSLECIYLRY